MSSCTPISTACRCCSTRSRCWGWRRSWSAGTSAAASPAALEGRRHGLIDNWLRHVQDVAHEHAGLLASAAEDDRDELLCRLNVVAQVTNACRTTIVQEAWDRGARLNVHGLVYGLADGVLRDLGVTTTGPDEVDSRREQAVARLSAGL